MHALWNEFFAIEPQAWNRLELGPLSMWLTRRGDEWRIFSRIDEKYPIDLMERRRESSCTFEAAGNPPPDETELNRWIMQKGCSDHVRFRPAMPDRPVVVRPSSPIILAPRAKGLFYVNVPLCVGVDVGQDSPVEICREPVIQLTNIWFGTPEHGELCYGLRSHALRNFDSLPMMPYRCICPVMLHNTSEENLHFERICLRVAHLSIYKDPDGGLWSNRVEYHAKGDEAMSKIEYSQTPPESDKKMTLLRVADSPRRTSMLMRGLASLRSRG